MALKLEVRMPAFSFILIQTVPAVCACCRDRARDLRFAAWAAGTMSFASKIHVFGAWRQSCSTKSSLCHRPNLSVRLALVIAQASIPLGVDIATGAWLLFDEAHCVGRD